MDQQTQKMSSSGSYMVLYGFKTVVGVVLLVLTIVWVNKFNDGFGWSSNPNLQFNWHPLMMILGLVFLYSQSILFYRTGRYNTSKKNLKYAHGIIHLLAFIASVIGLQAVFDSHNRNGFKNLYTLHSWIGLLTVIIFAAQFLGGFLAFLFPGAPGHIRKMMMPHHVFFGTLGYIMALITSVAGIMEMASFTNMIYSELPPVAYYLNFMALFVVLHGALTIYLLWKPEYKRIPLPED